MQYDWHHKKWRVDLAASAADQEGNIRFLSCLTTEVLHILEDGTVLGVKLVGQPGHDTALLV